MRTIKEVKGDLDKAMADMNTIMNDQVEGNWSDESEKRWDELATLHTEFEKELGDVKVHRDKERQLAEMRAKHEEDEEKQKHEDRGQSGEQRAAREGREVGETRQQMNERAIRAWFQGKRVTTINKRAADVAGLNIESNEIELSLNTDVTLPRPLVECRSGKMARYEWRQQATDPISAGGALVPSQQMLMPLETALLQFGGLRGISNVTRTASGAPIGWPTLDDTTNKGAIVGENSTITQMDLVFGQAETKPFKYTSLYIPVSWELIMDANQSMDAIVGTAIGTRIGRIQADHFAVGVGTTEPRGVTIDATDSGTTLVAADAPDYDEMVDIQHSLDPAYRGMSTWVFNDLTLAGLKKIVSTTGSPIWQQSLVGSEPNTVLGRPYVIDQAMPTGSSARSIAYGDFSKYKIHDAGSITMMRLTELHALNGQVTFLAWMRTDARLLDAGTGPVVYASNPV